jgi:hypothetical protein
MAALADARLAAAAAAGGDGGSDSSSSCWEALAEVVREHEPLPNKVGLYRVLDGVVGCCLSMQILSGLLLCDGCRCQGVASRWPAELCCPLPVVVLQSFWYMDCLLLSENGSWCPNQCKMRTFNAKVDQEGPAQTSWGVVCSAH